MGLSAKEIREMNNGKPQAEPTERSSQREAIASPPAPTAEETTALAALSQTAAGTIRQSIGAMNQIVEKLEDQRDMVTTHAAQRITAVLDPVSIQSEIAIKTLESLEGRSFIPFDLPPIELQEVQRYVPQLPVSYASPSLPASSSSSTSPIAVVASETISPGNSKMPVPAGTGFAEQRKAS